MKRVHNFFSGPAGLPDAVLKTAQAELLDWQGLGLSVMEISHRDKTFVACAEKIEADCRALLNVPDDYAVLFMQGGSRLQFANIAMNFGFKGGNFSANYVVSGHWSRLAAKEAARYGDINIVTDNEALDSKSVANKDDWDIKPANYLHYCSNETVHGVEFPEPPTLEGQTLVADMSSNIFSREMDVSKFGCIYACAQKTFGIAGLTLVIVRKDLMGHCIDAAPSVCNYEEVDKKDSMLNTPPCFAMYITGLMFEWMLAQGGLKAIEAKNKAKADKLYSFIDESEFYCNDVDPKYRSRMNVVFKLKDDSLNERFVSGAKAAGILGIKGHRAVGGMRVALYNAVTMEDVNVLLTFMKGFK